MRADRLISLLMLLQTRGRLTAQELALRLEVSERTIYRDLEALSSAGIPVYAERGPGGGISLVDGYQTRLTGLTATEAQALFLLGMAGPLSDLGLDRALSDALLKLSAALPTSQREDAQRLHERIHMDSTWWYYSRESLPHLSLLQEAVCHDSTILLSYLNEHDNACQRLLNPYGLVSKAGIWFLVALQAQSGERHVLRVSRIQSVECSGQSFTRLPDFDLAATWHEYCRSLEAQHPQLARSARAIPGEALSPATTPRRPRFIADTADLSAPQRAQQKKYVSRQAYQKKAFHRKTQQKNAPSPQQKKGGFVVRHVAASNISTKKAKWANQKKQILCNVFYPALTGRAFFMNFHKRERGRGKAIGTVPGACPVSPNRLLWPTGQAPGTVPTSAGKRTGTRHCPYRRRSACAQPLFSRIKRIDSEGVMRNIEMMQDDKGENACADAIR